MDLEDLERRLTILDEKIQALLTSHAPKAHAQDAARSGWATDDVQAEDESGATGHGREAIYAETAVGRVWNPGLSLFYLS